jgi:copper(I)-binding protein
VTRWTRCLLAGAIAILIPALAGCEAGMDAPTLEFHPASFGLSTTVNGIRIDNAFVLGPALDSTLPYGGTTGLFLSLSTESNGDKLVSVSAPGTASSVTLTGGPVTLDPNTLVDLSGPTPKVVLNTLTTTLSGGETVPIVLTFTNAGAVIINVPVEPAAYAYATFSPPAPTPSPSASASGKQKVVKPIPSARASSTASPAVSGTATPYSSPSASVSPSTTP